MTTSVYIAKSIYGGDGIGRLSDGRVVFVPGAFAGEHVKAEIVEEKRRFVRARLVEVEDASPDRTGFSDPPVPGMVYSNLSCAGECAAKSAQLAEALERARIALPPGGVRRTPVAGGGEEESLGYRNKATYRFAKSADGWKLGYVREPGHEIVDIERDPLAVAAINDKLGEIRRSVFALLTRGAGGVRRAVEGKAAVTVRWTRRSGVQWWLGDAPQGLVMKEEAMGRAFDVPADGFWQVNPAVGDALVKTVAAAFAREPAERLVDLYCGVGVLGISCVCAAGRKGAVRLAGVESGRRAAEFARRNAAFHGVEASFAAEETAKALSRLGDVRGATVITDPPRGGMEPKTVRWLAQSGAERIFCVSCDPATLVRDLKGLDAAYAVESVDWFNMFPRTARFETLAVLRRRRGSCRSCRE